MKQGYFVYILTNHSRVLYIGITSNLEARTLQHIYGSLKGFTSTYGLDQLVYLEEFTEVDQAIRREKQLKSWRRSKKLALIDAANPSWLDLAAELPHP